MGPIHAAVVSPFSGLLRIPHVLWYAHAAKPKSLLIARMFVSVIASSTSGSCPISGKKVRFIGQGVDCEVFGRRQFRPGYTYRFVYAGRMSQSKNIPLIINELKKARVKHPEITLHLIGNQSELYVNNGNSTWVSAMPALPRENLSSELEKYDVFIHAFVGSLDKVLVEATLKGLPVVTINGEYQKEFLHWDTNLCLTLETELQAFLNANWKSVANHVDSNYEIAIRKHELNGWTDRLCSLLAIAK
jgi:glycosyltransferase involved in cell wall biosynthesis